MSELIDLHQEFDKGNKYTLSVATELARILPEEYRVIVKYDSDDLPEYDDDKKNVLFATSREMHDVANCLFDKNVFIVFQNYFFLDRWDYPYHNPISFPMPIGTFVDIPDDITLRPLHQRKYDFSFVGQIPHTGTRDGFKRNLDAMLEETGKKFNYFVQYTDGFGDGLSHEDYLELLNDSKIVLCPCGAYSNETFRFFEAIRMGAFPAVRILPKFWYYENAPFLKMHWQKLDQLLSFSLNKINSDPSGLIDKIIEYNQTVLNEKRVANYLANVVKSKENMNQLELAQQVRKFKEEFDAST